MLQTPAKYTQLLTVVITITTVNDFIGSKSAAATEREREKSSKGYTHVVFSVSVRH